MEAALWNVPRTHGVVVKTLACVLALSCIFASPPACGDRLGPDPYAGVVSDSTITFIGREFYREFVASWRDQAQADQFSLAIHERPSARWGSLVWVEHSSKPLFRVFLSPGHRDFIRPAAREATQVVYRKVIADALERQFGTDPDLAPDEL